MIATKTDFNGGINQLSDITKLGPDQYWLLMNARVRTGAVEAVTLPLDVTGNLPVEPNMQDISAAGSLLIAFAEGKAYYRTTDGAWQLIPSFTMGSTQDRVYTEIIPGSTINYVRTAATSTSTFGLANAITASQAALIVMDGVLQPWVILPDGSARVCGTYSTWTINNPEYVPIANKPMFHDGVLYCVGKDLQGRETLIFRSATGQPLNYVVAVTPTGDKTSPLESAGGAAIISHQVGYDTITCLASANTSERSFIVSSTKKTYLVYPDTNNLIFGEPTFRNQEIASIGALNQNSIADVLGDVAVVHDVGIRSFNGILQFRYEGRNSPFSAPINSLLDGITQTAAATGTHDNYVMFALQTIYGNGILWYDTLRGVFVSLDIYPGIGQIRKFASVVDNGTRYTYFMTDNKVYQLFGSTQRATVTMYGQELIAPEDYSDIKINEVRLTFNGVVEGGTAEAVLFIDGQMIAWKSAQIAAVPTNASNQRSVAFDTPLTEGAIAQAQFNFTQTCSEGTRAGILVRFNTDGALVSASAKYDVGMKWPLVNSFGTITQNEPELFVVVGDDGVGPSGFTPEEYAARVALQRQMQKLKNVTKFIGTGDHAYNSGTVTEVTNNFAAFWGNVKDRLAFVPGNHDNDTVSGKAFFEYLAQPRYGVVSTQYVDIFLINTGFNSSMVQTEMDNAGVLKDSVQFTWLRQQLAASTKKHKWVVWHHPPVCSGTDYYPGVTQMQAIPLQNWGATALFCGHSHIVERLNWNGLLVIISGAGGRDFRPINSPASPFSIFAAGDISAYWEVTATALGALFVCKDSTGAILDRYFQAT